MHYVIEQFLHSSIFTFFKTNNNTIQMRCRCKLTSIEILFCCCICTCMYLQMMSSWEEHSLDSHGLENVLTLYLSSICYPLSLILMRYVCVCVTVVNDSLSACLTYFAYAKWTSAHCAMLTCTYVTGWGKISPNAVKVFSVCTDNHK